MGSPAKPSAAHIDVLGMETAFLIVTAASRDFDLSKWFNEKAYNGKIPVREFDAKILSLATAMGINQDIEIKRELEIATSLLSLRVVHNICSAGEDGNGELLINLNYLFKLSQQKVDRYLTEMQGKEESDEPSDEDRDFRTWEEGEYDMQGNLIRPSAGDERRAFSNDIPMVSSPMSAADDPATPAQQYLSDIQTVAQGTRPVSANAGSRAQQRGETMEQVLAASSQQSTSQSEALSRKSSGRYDLAARSYDYGAEDGEHLADAIQHTLPLPARETDRMFETTSTQPAASPTDWAAENRRLLSTPASSVAHSMRPRSAGAGAGAGSRGRQLMTGVSKSAPLRSRSVDHEMRRLAALVQSTNRVMGQLDARRSAQSHSTGRKRLPAAPISLSTDQENCLKDDVEDVLRACIKSADHFHLVQVNLGFIDSYTIVPHRGAIVVSKPTPWLPARSVQSAFLANRVHLNDLQLHVLTRLLQDFADQQPANDLAVPAPKVLSHKMATIPEPQEGDPVVGPHGSISAAWLRKYLTHLRLTNRRQSRAQTSRPTTRSASAPLAQSAQSTPAPAPASWQKWLNRKVQSEVATGPYKPRELQKALRGQPHGLTKDDVRLLLTPRFALQASAASNDDEDGYSDEFSEPSGQPREAAGAAHRPTIVPVEVLDQELNNRIQLWALDSDGRRDFQHQLNIKVRTHIHKELLQGAGVRPGKGETVDEACWSRWLKVSPERRKEIKAGIMKDLFDEKREQLRSQERAEGLITIDLFLQFSKSNQDRSPGVPWAEWLAAHLEKTRRHIEKLKEVSRQHKDLGERQRRRRQSMASLVAVEAKVKDLCSTLDLAHQVQVKKGLVALRKVAQSRGSTQVVTKEDFDRHIRAVLAPYVTLNETFLEAQTGATASDGEPAAAAPNQWTKVYQEKLVPLFDSDAQKTVSNILAAEEDKSSKNQKKFGTWLAEKKHREEEERKKKAQEGARQRAEEDERKRKSLKAYTKWLKARQRNKYRSQVDRKLHDVPAPRPLQHPDKWRRDTETQA